jgi:hypothetical protein
MNQTRQNHRILDSAVLTGITWHCREEEVCDCYRGQSSPKSFLGVSAMIALIKDLFSPRSPRQADQDLVKTPLSND